MDTSRTALPSVSQSDGVRAVTLENDPNGEERPPEHRQAADTAGPRRASNWRSHVSSCARLSSLVAVGGNARAERDKKLYEKLLINLSCSRQVSIRSLIRVFTP